MIVLEMPTLTVLHDHGVMHCELEVVLPNDEQVGLALYQILFAKCTGGVGPILADTKRTWPHSQDTKILIKSLALFNHSGLHDIP